jgi:DNA-binding transcriptional LysR family regulator
VALAPAQAAEGAYWLVWPKGAESPALSAFRGWLAAQVG